MSHNSNDRDFEPRIATWLEDDPNLAPLVVLDTVLAAFPSISQRRARGVPWRFQPMNRTAILTAATLGVAILLGGLALDLRLPGGVAGGPPAAATPLPPTPAPSPSPSAAYVAPSPVSLVRNLTASFTSPLYGYTIHADPSWSFTAATVPIDSPASTDATSLDGLAVTGTDTTITGASTALGSQTFTAWLVAHHADVLTSVPPGCDGGNPATWPTILVGGQQGHWNQLCNAVEVSVPVGDRVFLFSWSNATFDSSRHLAAGQFQTVLATVVLPVASAASPAPTSAP